MARPWLLALVTALVACGDNRAVPRDAFSEPVPDAMPACTPVAGTTVTAHLVASIGGTITVVTSPPDDPRLFAVVEDGEIWLIDNGVISPEPFLEMSRTEPPLVGSNQTEVGLLGLVFDPNYRANRTFYVFYTATNANDPGGYPFLDVLMRFTRSANDPAKADPTSGTVVLSIPDIAGNHNGGMLEFGPDGYLYVSTGDGGFQFDPARTGQDPHALLGKILRLDVENRQAGKEYAIPPDNPFADGIGGAPEVFILGLRNPWRFSFDRATGDLWIGDVGQDTIEELDYLPRGQQNGANLGWSMYEGTNCMHGPCDPAGQTFPVDQRTHSDGYCAVIGGAVYRGRCYPDLVGHYFYTDFCAHGLSRADVAGDGSVSIVDLPGEFPAAPASLHPDSTGELYLTDIYGNIFHLEASP